MRVSPLILCLLLISCSQYKEREDYSMDKTIEIIEQAEETKDILEVKNIMLKELTESTDSALSLLDEKNDEIQRLEWEKHKLKRQVVPIREEDSHDIHESLIVHDLPTPIQPIVIQDTLIKEVVVNKEIFVYDTTYVLITDSIMVPKIDSSSKRNIRIYNRIQKLLKKLEFDE